MEKPETIATSRSRRIGRRIKITLRKRIKSRSRIKGRISGARVEREVRLDKANF